jgi:CDP-diacylglycerol---glycerol-3-phosphate 3-phosphatidyltransferase
MIGRALGMMTASARDALARLLLRMGIGPNAVSAAGTSLSVLAGICYGVSCPRRPAWTLSAGPDASAWGMIAFGLLILSCACDMLDGAVARVGNRKTPFGGFLDSTLDRYGDLAIWAGIAMFYARGEPANLTFVLLCFVAAGNSFVISYTRARAIEAGGDCIVGFWQRGERMAAVLIATAAHNIPALVIQQAILPLFTVIRRMGFTKAVLEGRRPVVDPRLAPAGRAGWWLRVRIWRWPRGTIPHDVAIACNIAWLILASIPARGFDPLRSWL